MTHIAIVDATRAVTIQPEAVVSKVLHRGDGLEVTEFGFDAGEGLTEHTASRAAIVQVLSGRLRFTVDGEELDAGPGSWIYMTPGTPHSLVSQEPTVMLLTLLRP
ncbi:MAG: cupin domain-containing protein [Actinomycetota bacterium]